MDYPVVRAPRTTMTVVDAASYSGENVFICSAPLVRRQAVLDAGGFPEGLPMLEDFALWSKMIAAGGIFAPVEHVVATYRQRPNSMLRGEAGVTMASYVDVINEWMQASGTLLADGGGLAAWLEDRPPQSFGRMAWNAPSNLGSSYKASSAGSLRSVSDPDDVSDQITSVPAVGDFMVAPVTNGLRTTVQPWVGAQSDEPQHAIIVQSLSDSLAAIGLLNDGEVDRAVFADDPTDWPALWPLALAGISVRSRATIESLSTQPETIDRSTVRAFTDRSPLELIQDGVATLWPNPGTRSGSVVYVPAGFEEYPALDAWVSTALHALADRGLAPTLMAEPRARPNLCGYRSDLTSIALLRETLVIIAAEPSDRLLLEAVAPTIIFDPSLAGEAAGPRTAGELTAAIDALGLSNVPEA